MRGEALSSYYMTEFIRAMQDVTFLAVSLTPLLFFPLATSTII